MAEWSTDRVIPGGLPSKIPSNNWAINHGEHLKVHPRLSSWTFHSMYEPKYGLWGNETCDEEIPGIRAYYSLVYVYAVNTIQQDIAHEISLAGEKPEVMKSRWSRFRRQYISWKQHSCSKNKMNEPKATCTNSDELVMRFMALFSWVHVCMCVCTCVCVCVCVCWRMKQTTQH